MGDSDDNIDEGISQTNQNELVMVTKKDVNKQNQTNLIIARINGTTPLIRTTNTPNINTFDGQWPSVLNHFKKKKDQTQHDLEWEELFLRINHSLMIHMNTVKISEEKERKKKINELIKNAIPTYYETKKCNGNEFSRWKKFHQLIVLLFEKSALKKIPVDFAIQQLNGLGLTVNYLYFVSEDAFKKFLEHFMNYCVQRYESYQNNTLIVT
ncbi:14962_t:CDS:2 [Racocetra persica]|uniref:14962_t:CDS:1 n=1 Tax=Racocetra persica TaxID=160502 RepID=A0ACA9NY14_9GLOM|nr:14962_t:CDS:2 [Racocetra persica]